MGNSEGTSALQITERAKLRLTPNAAITIAGIIALAVSFMSVWTAVHQPWIGVSFVESESGLRVMAVVDDGPSSNILNPGDVVLALAGQKGSPVQLQSQDIIEDPDTISTLKERGVFRDRQSLIYKILQQPVVVLTLEDGRVLRIQPQDKRPIRSLPVSFWLLSLFGISALLIGAAVCALSQYSIPTRYLLLSGFGTVCLLNSANIFISRDIALEGSLYPWLTFFYHLGNNFFTLGMIGLIWSYPKPIGRFPLIPALVVFMLFFMLNENMEWMEMPGNSVLIQVPVYWILGIILISIQWRRSRGSAVDRAAIKVLTLMVFILILAIAGAYFAPIFFSGAPKVSLTGSFLGLFAFYIILGLAVQRFHLFDIDRWWIEVWLWFFAGAVVVVSDMALVTIANMNPSYALGVSVIGIGWLYFPVRQWVWSKLFHRTQYNLEAWMPLLVDHLLRISHKSDLHLWETVLNEVFHPLSIKVKEQGVTKAKITDDGVCLLTPCLARECAMELYYADRGRRLFNSDDIRLAQALFNITEQAISQQANYRRGMLEERKRIMRDLHDDVGGRLLTLMHAGPEESPAAAEALKSLRAIIYSLDTESQETLNTAVARWRIEALERCEQANATFEWRWDEQERDVNLTPRQYLNLTLIIREGLSNILRHAKAERAMFDLRMVGDKLLVTLMNDVGETGLKEMKPGKGLRNMCVRVEELGGEFHYTSGAGVFCVKFSVPVNETNGVIHA